MGIALYELSRNNPEGTGFRVSCEDGVFTILAARGVSPQLADLVTQRISEGEMKEAIGGQ